jgi:hypothetical protein
MDLHSIIIDKPALAWSISNPKTLSEEAVVERVLEYGDWKDVQKLFEIKSKPEIAKLFYKTTQKARSNYSPQIEHFFKLYFQKHVQ